jgi:predicted DsbA family dithiol-disulfide isomerase
MIEAAERPTLDVASVSARRLDIEVGFDFICPWCLIGKRNLDTAMGWLAAKRPDVAVKVRWRSQPLLPGTPAEGLPYAEFYRQRLGGRTAVALRQAQVLEAARRAGVTIAFDHIEVLPSTIGAHRLVAAAQRAAGNGNLASAVIDALFHAYFVLGHDIGQPAILRAVAAQCGVTGDAEAVPFGGEPFQSRGVPFFRFSGAVEVAGAQSPEVLLQAMELALDRGAAC